MHDRAFGVGLWFAPRLHDEEGKKRHRYAFERINQITVAGHEPDFAMKIEIAFIKLVHIKLGRGLLHSLDNATQFFNVWRGDILARPLDGQSLQLDPQPKYLLDVGGLEF